MRTILLAASAALVMAAAAPALADTINFSQFGPEYTSLSDPLTGLTGDGVSFTITGPGAGFTVLNDPNSWYGEFPNGTPLLFDNYASGAVTITFATPILSLTSLALQDNLFGPYSATLTAYNGATVVDTSTYSAVNPTLPQPAFSVSAPAITSVVITSTNDGEGWALGGAGGAPYAGTPEPTAWALMILGFGAAGAALRRRLAVTA